MGWFGNLRTWLNSLGSGGGGKRVAHFPTQTAGGEPILIDPTETVLGNADATEFFRDVCGGSLKDIMLRQGLTNVPRIGRGPFWIEGQARTAAAQQMGLFRQYGVRVTEPGEAAIYAKPGTYPHVEIGAASVAEEPQDGRPLVIRTSRSGQARATHATVVFTVFDARRQNRQKQVTVHFHGRGVVRAKGFTREVGSMGRPTHYDGEEVRSLISQRARAWGSKIHWCSPMERY
jgi:hypothetical protein